MRNQCIYDIWTLINETKLFQRFDDGADLSTFGILTMAKHYCSAFLFHVTRDERFSRGGESPPTLSTSVDDLTYLTGRICLHDFHI